MGMLVDKHLVKFFSFDFDFDLDIIVDLCMGCICCYIDLVTYVLIWLYFMEKIEYFVFAFVFVD
jgi:hypothetical protein